MKNKYIFNTTLILVFIFNILITPLDFNTTNSYKIENLSENFELLPDQSDGFFIIDKVANNPSTISITYFDGLNLKSTELDNINLNSAYLGAKAYNKNLYILTNDKTKDDKNNLLISKYIFSDKEIKLQNDYLYSIPDLYNYNISSYNNFDFGRDETLYIINSRKDIYAISSDNDSYHIYNGNNISSISFNLDKSKLYALTDQKELLCFNLTNGPSENLAYTKLNGNIDDHFYFLRNNIIISYTGKIYNIDENNNTLTEILTTDSYNFKLASTAFKDYILCKVDDKIINAYAHDDTKNYTAIKSLTLENKILRLATSNDICVAITSDNDNVKYLTIINVEDFSEIKNENSSDSDPSTNNNDNNSSTNNPNDENPSSNNDNNDTYSISSQAYNIDFQKRVITNVPLSTTIAVFKQNVTYTNYNISFTNYLGKSMSSGKLGTGTTVTFTNNNSTTSFKIIISGDVTGEGNINSRDISALQNYLGETAELTDEYLLAADMNNDTIINTLDLLAISKILRNY